MNGECALWSQQFLLLEGLRPAPSPVTLLGFSEGPAAALVVTQEPKSRPGLGQLQQEHPGAGLSWAQGVQCLLLLHRSSSFPWQYLHSSQLPGHEEAFSHSVCAGGLC